MTTAPIPSITDEQIAEIEHGAKVATQGQWQVADGHYPSLKEIKGPSFNVSIVVAATDLDFKDYMARTADAEHIAACNPTAILALISRLRAAERDAARYRWLRNHVCMGCPSPEGSQYKDAYLVVTGYGHDESEDLTDRAIDAAMSEAKS